MVLFNFRPEYIGEMLVVAGAESNGEITVKIISPQCFWGWLFAAAYQYWQAQQSDEVLHKGFVYLLLFYDNLPKFRLIL
jgi:hypothetical protein